MLYYPFADAPLPVLHQAILYWDSLATVVAPRWQHRLSDRMREVLDAGLYQPIEPYQSYEPVSLDLIQGELEHALAQVPLDDLIPPAEPPDGHATTLHVEKLHDSVVQELLRRGLVYRHPNSASRLIGSPALLHVVVSIVAGHVAAKANSRFGCTAPTGLRPYTDLDVAHRLTVEPLPGQDTTACWQVDLGSLLPIPRGDVMISDLVRFREEHDSERRRMMLAIDELLHQLKQQNRHPEDAFRLVERELSEASADLRAAVRATRRTWVTRSVAVTVAIASGLAASVQPSLLVVPLTVLSGIAVNVATGRIRHGSSGIVSKPATYTYLDRTQQLIQQVQ